MSNIDKFLIILNHSRDLLAFVNLTGVEPDIKRVLALVVVSFLVLVRCLDESLLRVSKFNISSMRIFLFLRASEWVMNLMYFRLFH